MPYHIGMANLAPDDKDVVVCLPRPARESLGGGRWLWRAPAKLNLTLAVSRLRRDGYHSLDSIVAKISLYDELIFQDDPSGQLTLDCPAAECGPMETNLVYQAGRLMRERCPGRGARITLTKHIPAGAGLGGGSSDAATTLQAIATLWDTAMPPGELSFLAAQLGSDVPLFLGGAASRMSGRGEIVEATTLPTFWALLLLTGLHCPTRTIYRAFDAQGGPGQTAKPSIAPAGRKRTDFARPVEQWDEICFNDLARPAMKVCPELAGVAEEFARGAGRRVHVTGSGSGLFILAPDLPAGQAVAAGLPAKLRSQVRLVCLNAW
jgi:4-diphosphocytidyl-2-C-methyl-D-erythritol kinase